LAVPLRIDPEQRFTCASCGRCCHRFEVLVSPAEVEWLRRHDAGRWFRETADAPEGADVDPFETLPGLRVYHRIRKREDGACGFLSPAGRCRLHEELGAARKPLTCRMFPYHFHPAPGAVVVTTSFSCPTVAANQGERIAAGARLEEIESLRNEWFAGDAVTAAPRQLVAGRPIEAASLRILRDGLLTMLARENGDGTRDLRANVRRMAQALDDLTRRRVLNLPDPEFAEYLALTIPYAAASREAVAARPPSQIGRLMQHGFLFVVAATRLRLEHRDLSRWRLRLTMLRLLAHFHRIAPPAGGVDLSTLAGARVDVNAPGLQPIAYHYLRASLESLGASELPVLDALAIAVSQLNAACALAIMKGPVDRERLIDALTEAADLAHTGERGIIGRSLARFAGGTEALYAFGSQR
jgi:Fe-S-cluster containining protein